MLIDKYQYSTELYRIEFDLIENECAIFSILSNKMLFRFAIDSAIDTLTNLDKTSSIELLSNEHLGEIQTLTFEIKSNIWPKKQVLFELHPAHILYQVIIAGRGQRITDLNYFVNRNGKTNTTDFTKIYSPRFDWLEGEVVGCTSHDESLGCQQWLSPPPFCYAFLSEQESVSCGVAVNEGEYNFLSFDYTGSQGPSFRLTYEAHTVADPEFVSPKLVIGFGSQDKNEAIANHINWLRKNNYLRQEQNKTIPNWWREPLFCGWGQMRYDYRFDHDGHENDSFINVTFYCTEKLYRNYVASMAEHNINPGTIIIDMGWAEQPALHTPSKKRWSDMRGFIEEQHQLGRKVLLWYTPVVTEGLPLEACMTLSGKPVCPDPTSPAYIEILENEIRRMVSADVDCLNADGFKIDFTQNTPSENGRFTGYINNFWGLINESNAKYLYAPLGQRTELIKTHDSKWGVEILKAYIRLIYQSMKKYKPDSMLITHTANPYFAEVVDVLRLNDLDGECEDVLGVMHNRAKIAKMCSKNWLIDTDNDLMVDKDRWRAYIKLQPQLGIPDTYYINAIANSLETFDDSDYDLLRQIWDDYRQHLGVRNNANI